MCWKKWRVLLRNRWCFLKNEEECSDFWDCIFEIVDDIVAQCENIQRHFVARKYIECCSFGI